MIDRLTFVTVNSFYIQHKSLLMWKYAITCWQETAPEVVICYFFQTKVLHYNKCWWQFSFWNFKPALVYCWIVYVFQGCILFWNCKKKMGYLHGSINYRCNPFHPISPWYECRTFEAIHPVMHFYFYFKNGILC